MIMNGTGIMFPMTAAVSAARAATAESARNVRRRQAIAVCSSIWEKTTDSILVR